MSDKDSLYTHAARRTADRLLASPELLTPLAEKLALDICRVLALRPDLLDALARKIAVCVIEEAERRKVERNGQANSR